jgi:hypothetical protein
MMVKFHVSHPATSGDVSPGRVEALLRERRILVGGAP